jgi:spore coat polysaccharide biosynthesis protein SpsF (cytidylyltransferase family)
MIGQYPILILECANAHDGKFNILKRTINSFSKIIYSKLHIKFQPFSANTISTHEYKWHKIYKKLEFKSKNWDQLIKLASKKYSGVWLDIFDDFGVEILERNFKLIYGIKMQSSTLENKKVIEKLSKLKMSKKHLILNISGKTFSEINTIFKNFKSKISNNLIFQCGYQDYPTDIKETNFKKILFLNKKFPNYNCSYSDHLDSDDIRSLFVPIKAMQNKCYIIEKHISIRGKKTLYDHCSALDLRQAKKMIEIIKFFLQNEPKKFTTKKEEDYLKKTVQLPVANIILKKNDFMNINNISYLRTNHNSEKIINIDYDKYYIAIKNIEKDELLTLKNVKRLRVGVFIACRLKSNRLKNKAILKLTSRHTLIEKCILSAKKIKFADLVVVTTSNTTEDNKLESYCKKHLVKFFKGSKDNVIKRYCDAAKKYNIDVIIRVTGDCPEISDEIVNIVFKKHIEEKSDYSVAKKCPTGYGAEVINVSALKKILHKKRKAEMSEYMTYYFINNPEKFKLNFVDLPMWMRKNYRMTIDYKEDLIFFKTLYKFLKKEKKEVNYKNINYIISKYKFIKKINYHKKLIYKTNQELIDKINKNTLLN